MGLVQNFLLQLADAFQFLLVALGDVLESLVSGLDAFQLFIQSLAVTGNLAEIALYVHILFPCPGFSILDYGLGHTHLAGQFKGERISWQPGLKFEERGYILGIKKHCPVEHPVVAGSIEFEIGIVGCNHAIDSPPVEFRKYGFSNSSSRRRFSTASEFVYQHECPGICLLKHLIHVGKEGTICTEVIFNGLVIAYVHHYPVENHHFGTFRGRNQHTPLEHILKKADCLQAN